MTKSNALDCPMIALSVRGLSVRDAEAALAESLGDQAAVSSPTHRNRDPARRSSKDGPSHRIVSPTNRGHAHTFHT
jgi:putative transposase